MKAFNAGIKRQVKFRRLFNSESLAKNCLRYHLFKTLLGFIASERSREKKRVDTPIAIKTHFTVKKRLKGKNGSVYYRLS